MCEAIPRQVNYLIDEASDVGKGANTTISYVHHHFEHHGLGDTSVHLHITVRVKTKTIILYGTWPGGQYFNFIILLNIHFSLLDTRSLELIDVLVSSRDPSN